MEEEARSSSHKIFFHHLNIFTVEIPPSKEVKIVPSIQGRLFFFFSPAPSARSFTAVTIHSFDSNCALLNQQ